MYFLNKNALKYSKIPHKRIAVGFKENINKIEVESRILPMIGKRKDDLTDVQ